MEIKAHSIELVSVDQIIVNSENNNKHSEQQKEYARKIFREQGFRVPLLISKRSNKLIAGHLRLEIAKEEGLKKVPCMFQDFESESQEYAHMTADNALASQAVIDLSLINEKILDLGPDFDLDLLGINGFTIEPLDKLIDQNGVESNNQTFKLEVTFKNQMELMDLHDELISKGHRVKVKKGKK